MKLEKKNLTLFENLYFSKDLSSDSLESEKLYVYKNNVKYNETAPVLENFLTEEEFLGYGNYGSEKEKCEAVLPKGKYFFIQTAGSVSEREKVLKAAEQMYLDSLWEEKRLSDTVYVREIKEGSGSVFQVIREVIG